MERMDSLSGMKCSTVDEGLEVAWLSRRNSVLCPSTDLERDREVDGSWGLV
jgi:hypothetical protein